MKAHFKSRKLHLESLEERVLLAITAGGIEQAALLPGPTGSTLWTVNTLDDPTSWYNSDTILSLREAINRASAGDTIQFDPSLKGKTIVLSGRQLWIDEGVTIDAASIGGMTVDADGRNVVFYISG